jgi:hypothetical protein
MRLRFVEPFIQREYPYFESETRNGERFSGGATHTSADPERARFNLKQSRAHSQNLGWVVVEGLNIGIYFQDVTGEKNLVPSNDFTDIETEGY